jgi:phosphoribosylformimino-5-aminoimidazole carboxamide ribotide isomerase
VRPRLIPVIDLRGGIVVRAMGGRRSEYRPLTTCLTDDPTPARLAAIFSERFGTSDIYVADLDAIAGREPNQVEWRAIAAAGLRLWLDAGIATVAAAGEIAALSWPQPPVVIVGLETLRDPRELPAILNSLGPENAAFSLDLRAGRPITSIPAWSELSPETIAAEAIAAGFCKLILLDLARVGGGEGSGTGELCRALRRRYSALELAVGGGIRSEGDLRRAAADGASAVLVASTLHDGRIAPDGSPKR